MLEDRAERALAREPSGETAAGRKTLLDWAHARLKSTLELKWAPWAIIGLSLLLASPSLASGIAGDDYFHRILLKGIQLPGVHGRPLDLFVFSTGDPAIGRAQQQVGMLGWWADPEVKLAFLRPISALTHALDYALWPEHPVYMHVQSLAWFGASLILLFRFYRRFETPWVACLALLLYGIDDAHGFAISWIANRNALVALVFGLIVLLLHDRWRRDNQRWAAPLGILVFLGALLAGESAIAVTAYLFSYALFLDRQAWRSRLGSLIPYAIVVVVWRLVYSALGYGAEGSGLAIDPARSPLTFAAAIVERWPVLLTAQLAFPAADLWVFYAVVAKWLPALVRGWTLIAVAGFCVVFWPLLVRDSKARFWALGAALSALPACAQVPNDRLLFFCGVGAMGLLARFFVAVLERDPSVWTARGRRVYTAVVAVAFFAIHVPFAAYAFPLRVQGVADARAMLGRADQAIPDTPEVEKQSVILVNTPADAVAGYLPMLRAAFGRHRPRHLRWLATGASPVRLERIDATRLRVIPEDGFLFQKLELMQRSPERLMPLGHRVELGDLTITIVRLTQDLRPAEVEVTFREPLESPSILWFEWARGGFRPFPSSGRGRAHDAGEDRLCCRAGALNFRTSLMNQQGSPATDSSLTAVLRALDELTETRLVWPDGLFHPGGPHRRLKGEVYPISIGEDECRVFGTLIRGLPPSILLHHRQRVRLLVGLHRGRDAAPRRQERRHPRRPVRRRRPALRQHRAGAWPIGSGSPAS